jgi:mono/diheme cytochrome c family protein
MSVTRRNTDMRRPSVCIVVTFGAVVLFSLSSPAASADGGVDLYDANCVKCHGVDGRGDTPVGRAMKAASLVDPKWAVDDSAEAVVSAFRANPKHKAVASKVSDDDLRSIAVYLRKLASTE